MHNEQMAYQLKLLVDKTEFCLGQLSFNRVHKEITVLTIKYFLAASSTTLELQKVF